MATPNTDLTHFRFYEDDATNPEDCSPIAAIDTPINRQTGTANRFMLRICVQNDASSNFNDTLTWEYRRQPFGGSFGAWATLNATSTYCATTNGMPTADDGCGPVGLLGGSGSYTEGLYNEDDGVTPATVINKSNHGEYQICAYLVSEGDETTGDVIEFRHQTSGTEPSPTSAVPTVTLTATGPITVAPADGILTLAGLVATILLPVVVAPAAGSLTLTGLTPTISTASGAASVTPATGSLTLTGVAPWVFAAPVGAIISNGTGGGNWNVGSTWAGGTVPDPSTDEAVILDGDTVTITANLNWNTGSGNITVNGGGILVGTGGVTLTLAASDLILTNDGSTKCGHLHHTGTGVFTVAAVNSFIIATGINDANRCEITGSSSANHIRFTHSGALNQRCLIQWQWADVSFVGNATNDMAQPWQVSGGTVFIEDCLIDTCGRLLIAGAMGATAVFRFNRNNVKNGQAAATIRLGANPSAITSGTREILDNYMAQPFDAAATSENFRDFDIDRNVVIGRMVLLGNDQPASVDSNVFAKSTAAVHSWPASPSNNYILQTGSENNPHMWEVASGRTGTFAATGNIFEHAGSISNGDGFLISGSMTWNITYNIVLPNAAGSASFTLVTALGGAGNTFTADHNSFWTHAGQVGISIGENYAGHTGMCPSARSNLAIGSVDDGVVVYSPATPVDGYVTVADFNTGWNVDEDNALTDNYAPADSKFGTAPGANDINQNPNLVDYTRDIVSWGESLGLVTPTVDDVLAELAKMNTSAWDTNFTPAALIAWVKAGWAPQNASLQDAGHDGVTIGAVELSAAGTVSTPATGSLTLTGQAPTVLTPVAVTPAAGSLTLTGPAPSVLVPTAVTPDTGSLDLVGLAPTVAAATSALPGSGSLTLTGFAPTISAAVSALPAAGSLSLAGLAPTIVAAVAAAPAAGSLTLTGFAPEVTAATTVAPSTGSLTLTGSAPTVVAAVSVAPATGSLTLLGHEPSVGAATTAETAAGALTLTGFAPTANVSVSAAPDAGALTLTGFAPTVIAAVSAEPATGTLTLTGLEPTTSAATTVAPAAGALSLTGLAPTVSAAVAAQPAAGSLSLTGHAPAAGAGASAEPDAGALTLAGFAPTVVAAVSAEPGSGALTLTGLAGVVVTPASAATTTGSATLTGLAPSVLTATTVEPATGSLTLAGSAPTIAAAVSVTAGAGSLTLTGFAPVAATPSTATADVGALTLTGFAPTVDAGQNVAPAPAVGSLTLTGAAPTIAAAVDAQTDVGVLTLTGLAPTTLVAPASKAPFSATFTTGAVHSSTLSTGTVASSTFTLLPE